MSAISYTPISQRVRPSKWWFALCPLLLIGGTMLAVGIGVNEYHRAKDTYQRLGTDGTGTVHLDTGEQRTVFVVWSESRVTETIQRPTNTVTVTGPGGEEVDVQRPSNSKETFQGMGDTGIKVADFTAPRTGDYEVTITFEAGGQDVARPLAAIGDFDVLGAVGRTLLPSGMGAVGAFLTLITVLIARSRSRKRINHVALTNPGTMPGPLTLTPTPPPTTGTPPPNQGPISYG